ncbi:hypothetical protein [Rhizorhabdus dicambivorans]|uniref:STAS/SEC14 domain-containing protein n=1 Tax=Rhizorhabdus dicambivorans TaxID=1850238 RepID=A0A2A4FNV3_9SPHN|nr:hypothetical protein [Rhizorhabdus dicambivorans]PCE40083.1 hypothetical protein COO09_22265 [Rhizorhabdus dicambivorans]
MNGGEYVAECDIQARILSYKVSGFWSPEQIDAFGSALADGIETMRRAGIGQNEFSVISDLTELAVQSPDAVKQWRSVIARYESSGKDWLVVIPRTGLLDMQARRVRPAASRVFSTTEEARAWVIKNRQTALAT